MGNKCTKHSAPHSTRQRARQHAAHREANVGPGSARWTARSGRRCSCSTNARRNLWKWSTMTVGLFRRSPVPTAAEPSPADSSLPQGWHRRWPEVGQRIQLPPHAQIPDAKYHYRYYPFKYHHGNGIFGYGGIEENSRATKKKLSAMVFGKMTNIRAKAQLLFEITDSHKAAHLPTRFFLSEKNFFPLCAYVCECV